jgi:hypothetical protein
MPLSPKRAALAQYFGCDTGEAAKAPIKAVF